MKFLSKLQNRAAVIREMARIQNESELQLIEAKMHRIEMERTLLEYRMEIDRLLRKEELK